MQLFDVDTFKVSCSINTWFTRGVEKHYARAIYVICRCSCNQTAKFSKLIFSDACMAPVAQTFNSPERIAARQIRPWPKEVTTLWSR